MIIISICIADQWIIHSKYSLKNVTLLIKNALFDSLTPVFAAAGQAQKHREHGGAAGVI